MQSHSLITTIAIMAQVVSSIVPPLQGILPRADVSYPCPATDHWFKHGRAWIKANSADGCMALETNITTIYALNALEKPEYRDTIYPNLICSLCLDKCAWMYSPLDTVLINPCLQRHMLMIER